MKDRGRKLGSITLDAQATYDDLSGHGGSCDAGNNGLLQMQQKWADE